jgi:pimeloyl-ACP methyl ester carboxylesterase
MSSYRAPTRTIGRLERPFGKLYYEVSGSGPALLFAHGLGGNHLSWWQQVAHFAPHYTCVAFAHRGFAPSDAIAGGPDAADYRGDLEALIDHLKLNDVRLVGQSMGGWTMLEYAIAHPQSVKALVLSSTHLAYPQPYHTSVTYVSNDDGRTWQRSNHIDIGLQRHSWIRSRHLRHRMAGGSPTIVRGIR